MSAVASERASIGGVMGCCFMCALPMMTVRSNGDRLVEGKTKCANSGDEASGSASIAKVEFCPRWRKQKFATGSGDNEDFTIVSPLECGCLWESQRKKGERYDDAHSVPAKRPS